MAFIKSLIKGSLFSKHDVSAGEQEKETRVPSLQTFVDILFE